MLNRSSRNTGAILGLSCLAGIGVGLEIMHSRLCGPDALALAVEELIQERCLSAGYVSRLQALECRAVYAGWSQEQLRQQLQVVHDELSSQVRAAFRCELERMGLDPMSKPSIVAELAGAREVSPLVLQFTVDGTAPSLVKVYVCEQSYPALWTLLAELNFVRSAIGES